MGLALPSCEQPTRFQSLVIVSVCLTRIIRVGYTRTPNMCKETLTRVSACSGVSEVCVEYVRLPCTLKNIKEKVEKA